ncbi:60S ribosomal protein L4 [Spraguea lophii 42_110]|uniref:Large ribosomal subunit protein uL4 n=1 Tax=Spraguea lophii (strain 42_110) TaxID=1358809 RepID=S7WCM8_SPRLO|nr:Chain LC0, 60S ribosomal protein L4 [Spraguea lophii 42_110]7QJH_KC0 Chain KC0, 60S ribosomal protein L4 [Spraguea lophii 42_110]7QJH_LC0 Chain LC0, 60S ribosomal protein L4 [Spraguea lophii 42_110]8BR3_LC0 Chain LC0, 60S ribosomal protein L4 [Spraguea lophii 42_110]8P5D_LC0 Chain LC0, 60S ribosomal protein L4 [Spraguea lophii 42_110]8P60_KC0 Chain KC0, 60S ribosomal protein L4 [Spraguea lophii 42_110]8P60_LC0 Chain LC0, 60S ribosomal protein L4 [Spraguea lophii 42_110]EPR79557.1 60S ribo
MSRQVNIIEQDGTSSRTTSVPAVFNLNVRQDLISFTHKNVAMNSRQPYAVKPGAGMRHSAKSWGTGRAMARVPRVRAGGTRRAGQGANANFCRGGRMFAPTNVNRRWNRKTLLSIRRYASAMAVAATSIPAYVEGRGHRIEQIENIPLVLSNKIDTEKTKEGIKILYNLGLKEELDKVEESKNIRAGKGKWRNRRYVLKKGPLFVYTSETSFTKAIRNIPGVDTERVENLSILDLAPGGQAGRLIIWMEDAFEKLTEIYGEMNEESKFKKGYTMGMDVAENIDVENIFYSDEVQEFIDIPNFIKKDKMVMEKNKLAEIQQYVEIEERI